MKLNNVDFWIWIEPKDAQKKIDVCTLGIKCTYQLTNDLGVSLGYRMFLVSQPIPNQVDLSGSQFSKAKRSLGPTSIIDHYIT